MKKFLVSLLLIVVVASNVFAGWEEFAGNYFYKDENGEYLKNTITPDGFSVNQYGICDEKANIEESTASLEEEKVEKIVGKDFSSKKVGDSFTFGKFYINSTSEKSGIRWVVANIDEDKKEALLVSKYVLALWSYNETRDKSKEFWENCSLRKTLNNYFYNECFSEKDKEYIIEHKLNNSLIYDDGRTGGNDTFDNVFVLSADEYEKYVHKNNLLKLPDDYSHRNSDGTRTPYAKMADNRNTSIEWLRAPYTNSIYSVACARSEYNDEPLLGETITLIKGCRPAIYIKIK